MESEPWFIKYSEIEKLYTLFGYTQLLDPLRYFYTPTPNYLQEGPQCGLVALAIVTQNATKESVQNLFETAKSANFTYNGEMFSVQEMCELAKSKLNRSAAEVFKGNLNCMFIKEFLLNGGRLLVPYDSAKDFTPCNKNGHKAHWSAITGAVECGDHSFFVLARQGKSKNVGVWSLEALAESNSQLEEFSPDRKLENINYKIPDGGIAGPRGLKCQSVLIYPSERISDTANLNEL